MTSFKDMPLPAEIQSALMKLKFENPTEIQQAVIPVVESGEDLIATAETGSGKTGGYGIPMVARLLQNPRSNGLILAPTRELAHQIADFIRDLTSDCKNFHTVSLVGGTDIRKQFQGLKRKPRILVATPGRITDHLKRKSVNLNSTEIMILDEGDRMLDMGFAPQIDEIIKFLPKKRQTLLFTATLPDKVQRMAEKLLNKPKKLKVGRVSLPVASIKQSVVQVTFKEKDERIIDELNQREGSVIVFCRTKNRTDILCNILDSYGFKVGIIHGGRTQGQRNKAIREFKNGRTRILCATDVAARGIDIPSVAHVINFDLPMMEEDYVHRIGRTARNGADGEAMSFVMPDEVYSWNALARTYKIPGVALESTGRGRGGQRKRSGSVGRFSKNKSKASSEDSFGPKSFKSRRPKKSKSDWPGRNPTEARKAKKSPTSRVSEIIEFEESASRKLGKKNSTGKFAYGKSGENAVRKKKSRDLNPEDNPKFPFRKKRAQLKGRDPFGRPLGAKKKDRNGESETSSGENKRKKLSQSRVKASGGSSSLKKKSARDFVKTLSKKKKSGRKSFIPKKSSHGSL